jgi:Protein of unknown function (DUF4127)
MNKKIVALPVDGRPVVREQVRQLVSIADWQLVMPDVSQLGDFRAPADRDTLQHWLLENAEDADGFVLSFDMLIYGGLVPSRFIEDAEDALLARLSTVLQMKERCPTKPIYGFIATMRMSNNNINEEEKTYWDRYGELIWRWSFYSDRYTALGNVADDEIAKEAMSAIPDAIRADYLATRKRNFSVTQRVLEMVERGVIDRLILPQDDTSAYGFNIAERRVLQETVSQPGIESRVRIYPGADEVIHTLCAHMVATLMRQPAIKFFITPTDPDNIKQLRARYEDRPVLDSTASQIDAVGGVMVESADDADVQLLVHSSGVVQGDWAMRLPLASASEITPALLKKLTLQQRKPIAVLDIAYANGGDPVLINALNEVMPLTSLAAYAGWNTASNSAGSLLAQCVFAACNENSLANQEVLCLRFLEDYLYQAVIRQQIRDEIDETKITADALLEKVSASFIPQANQWLAEQHFPWRVASIYLPWKRTFEIGIVLEAASLGCGLN